MQKLIEGIITLIQMDENGNMDQAERVHMQEGDDKIRVENQMKIHKFIHLALHKRAQANLNSQN